MGDLPGSNHGLVGDASKCDLDLPMVLQVLQVHVNTQTTVAGQGEVIIATILVLPVRCRTGGIGPYQRMQSTYSYLLSSVLIPVHRT